MKINGNWLTRSPVQVGPVLKHAQHPLHTDASLCAVDALHRLATEGERVTCPQCQKMISALRGYHRFIVGKIKI